MSTTVIGMATAAVIALTWVEYGFWWGVFVAVAIAIGAIIGRVLDGKLDLKSVADAFRGKRSSS